MEDDSGAGSGPGRRAPSRRAVLVTGGVLAAGAAAGGAALGARTGRGPSGPLYGTAAAELRAALAAEQRLLDGVDTALRGASAGDRGRLLQVRAGHVAHRQALAALVADDLYPATPVPSTAPAGSGAAPSTRGARPGASRTTAQVRTAERRAGDAAAARAARSPDARHAALLASIAAAEAAHAELLR